LPYHIDTLSKAGGFELSEKITSEEVVGTWYMRAIGEFFWAFKVGDEDFFSMHKAFHLSMGFELACKAYLLGWEKEKYEGLPFQKGKEIVNTLAKGFNHKYAKIFKSVGKHLGELEIKQLLEKDYLNYCGKQIIGVLQDAYLEARYPVPNPSYRKFPMKNGGGHWNPMQSSALPDFCHDVVRKLSLSMKNEMNLRIPKMHFDSVVYGSDGQRFINVLFEGDPSKFINFS
jgi:hypothetical protein